MKLVDGLIGVGVVAIALAACGDPPRQAGEATPAMDGMDMGGDSRGAVQLDSGQAERIGLRWAEAKKGALERTTRTSAVIEYPESEMLWVSPKVSGWVERLHVGFEGETVTRGQALLEIYSPDLVTAQEELLLARRLENELMVDGAVRGRDSLAAVARRRLAYWDISDAQIDRLLATGETRKTLALRSPASGVVMKKQVFEGQGVSAGDNLLMISPTDPVWIQAAVYEQDLPFVREGLPVKVDVQGLPGETLEGRVAILYPEVRDDSRTLVARIEVDNPRGRLRPGMFAIVLISSRTEPVLTVPSSAILHTGTRDLVFVDMGEHRVMPLVVRVGRAGDDRVEVLEGLSEGDRVATAAQFLLDSESNLMDAMQAMMVQMGQSGGQP